MKTEFGCFLDDGKQCSSNVCKDFAVSYSDAYSNLLLKDMEIAFIEDDIKVHKAILSRSAYMDKTSYPNAEAREAQVTFLLYGDGSGGDAYHIELVKKLKTAKLERVAIQHDLKCFEIMLKLHETRK